MSLLFRTCSNNALCGKNNEGKRRKPLQRQLVQFENCRVVYDGQLGCNICTAVLYTVTDLHSGVLWTQSRECVYMWKLSEDWSQDLYQDYTARRSVTISYFEVVIASLPCESACRWQPSKWWGIQVDNLLFWQGRRFLVKGEGLLYLAKRLNPNATAMGVVRTNSGPSITVWSFFVF